MSINLKLGYYILKGLIFGVKFPVGISVDVTYKCNLRCKHCYFFEQGHENELSKEDMINTLKKLKKDKPSIISAGWVGGEPLLRKDVVEEGMKLFPMNMIVTNGTIELPKWNCSFHVSVDGTKDIHEKIRGIKIYDRIKENIENRKDVNVACVINTENYHCIEDMLKEWSKTKIKGMSFDFYTPIKGKKEKLWLSWKERDKIIQKLLQMKKDYGNFILDSNSVLEMMLSKNASKTTSNCILKKSIISLDPMGNRKLPCILGEKADCSRCGCIIPFIHESILVKKDLSSRNMLKNMV